MHYVFGFAWRTVTPDQAASSTDNVSVPAQGASPNAQDRQGQTPFMRVVVAWRKKLTKWWVAWPGGTALKAWNWEQSVYAVHRCVLVEGGTGRGGAGQALCGWLQRSGQGLRQVCSSAAPTFCSCQQLHAWRHLTHTDTLLSHDSCRRAMEKFENINYDLADGTGSTVLLYACKYGWMSKDEKECMVTAFIKLLQNPAKSLNTATKDRETPLGACLVVAPWECFPSAHLASASCQAPSRRMCHNKRLGFLSTVLRILRSA